MKPDERRVETPEEFKARNNKAAATRMARRIERDRELMRLVIEYRGKGLTYAQIGEKLGWSEKSIQTKASAYGLANPEYRQRGLKGLATRLAKEGGNAPTLS